MKSSQNSAWLAAASLLPWAPESGSRTIINAQPNQLGNQRHKLNLALEVEDQLDA